VFQKNVGTYEQAQRCNGSCKSCVQNRTKHNGSKIDNPGSSVTPILSNTALKNRQRYISKGHDVKATRGSHGEELGKRSKRGRQSGESRPRGRTNVGKGN
jgi:hypothetical protein